MSKGKITGIIVAVAVVIATVMVVNLQKERKQSIVGELESSNEELTPADKKPKKSPVLAQEIPKVTKNTVHVGRGLVGKHAGILLLEVGGVDYAAYGKATAVDPSIDSIEAEIVNGEILKGWDDESIPDNVSLKQEFRNRAVFIRAGGNPWSYHDLSRKFFAVFSSERELGSAIENPSTVRSFDSKKSFEEAREDIRLGLIHKFKYEPKCL